MMRSDLSSYFEEPDFKQLIAKYEGMVKNHTPIYFDTDELTDLADYYIYIGKETEADKVMEYSLQLHPNNTDALIYKIRTLYFNGNKEEAQQLFNLIEDTTDREVLFLRADLLIEEKKYKEAECIYQELAKAEGESLQILSDIVICYMDVNNKEYARQWLSKIEEKGYNQENSQIYRDLWCEYCMTFDNPQEAEIALQMSVDEHPYSIKYWNGLAKCYLAQCCFQKAHEAIDFSLAIDENNQESCELKAYCFMQEENYEEAIRIYEQISQTSFNNKDRIFSQLAQCYVSLGKFYRAIDYYTEWLTEYPQISNYVKAEIYRNISECYCNLGELEQGMKFIDFSLEYDPLAFEAILHKASIYLNVGDYQSAEYLFQKAEEICPDDERENMLYAIALSYFLLKQHPQVIEWCEKAMKEYPDSVKKGIVQLSYSYFQIGDHLGGFACLREAVGLYKNNQLDEKNAQMLRTMINDMQERNKDKSIDLSEFNL